MVGLFEDSGVSGIGLGTWQLGLKGWGSGYEEKELLDGLRFGIENGLNFIDTAEIYGMGKSETLVGKAVKDFDRKEYFIATKLAGFNASARRAWKSLTGSLTRLGLDYVDLYQVHWEPSMYTSIPDLFRELERLAKDGLIGHIGVSNFGIKSIEVANDSMKDLRVESNQIKFNMVERPKQGLLEFMKKNEVRLIAWSPLAQGFLSGKYSGSNKPSGSVRKINRMFSSSSFQRFGYLLSELRRVSEEKGVSPIQLVLAYERQLDVLPIPGFRNTKQVKDLISANSLSLSKENIDSIDSALQRCIPFETTTGFYPSFIPNFIARLGFILM